MRNLLYVIILLLGFTSCSKKIVEVPVETIKKEYIYNTRVDTVRDSVIVKDSVFSYIKGDTVYNNKISTQYKYKYKYINTKDTVHIIDSIPKVITVTKEVTTNSKKSTNVIKLLAVLLLVLASLLILKSKKKNG